MALTQFKTNCHEELKLLLAAARPDTLEKALEIATASNLDNNNYPVNYVRHNPKNNFTSQNQRNSNYKGRNYDPNYQRNSQSQYNTQKKGSAICYSTWDLGNKLEQVERENSQRQRNAVLS